MGAYTSLCNIIYSPETTLHVINVDKSECKSRESSQLIYVDKGYQSVTVNYPVVRIVGTRRYTTYETRTELKRVPGELKYKYTPPSSIYVVFAHCVYATQNYSTPHVINFVCMSQNRQDEIIAYLKPFKTIRVRFLLGCLVCPELNYNSWFENPLLLFSLINVPVLSITALLLKYAC